MIKLSVLIANTTKSLKTVQDLLFSLEYQIQALPKTKQGLVEILVFTDNDRRTRGKKQNELLRQAQGRFISFIHEEDLVSNDYIESILNEIEKNPNIDAIVFKCNNSYNIATSCFAKDLVLNVSYELEQEEWIAQISKLIDEKISIPKILYSSVVPKETSNSTESNKSLSNDSSDSNYSDNVKITPKHSEIKRNALKKVEYGSRSKKSVINVTAMIQKHFLNKDSLMMPRVELNTYFGDPLPNVSKQLIFSFENGDEVEITEENAVQSYHFTSNIHQVKPLTIKPVEISANISIKKMTVNGQDCEKRLGVWSCFMTLSRERTFDSIVLVGSDPGTVLLLENIFPSSKIHKAPYTTSLDNYTTLFVIDDKDKKSSFAQYSSKMKPNDVILAHNYVINDETFEKSFKGKIWNNYDISYVSIRESVVKNQLKPYLLEEFLYYAFASFEK